MEELLDSGVTFVLTSRLTQDCLENFFSVVRLRKPTPSCLEFRAILKLISTAQFLKVPKSTSYQQSDGAFLAEFVDLSRVAAPSDNDLPDTLTLPYPAMPSLDTCDRSSLYSFAGYCVHSIQKTSSLCQDCVKSISTEELHSASRLTALKEYKDGCLIRVCDTVFQMFCTLEIMFRAQTPLILESLNRPITDILMSLSTYLCKDYAFPDCCDLKAKLCKKFLRSRVQASSCFQSIR